MLVGEREGVRWSRQRQQWSPELQLIGRTFSYYKQKSSMCAKKLIHWPHLESLQKFTEIPDADHHNTDHKFILQQLRKYRAKWKAWKQSAALRQKFWNERAESWGVKGLPTVGRFCSSPKSEVSSIMASKKRPSSPSLSYSSWWESLAMNWICAVIWVTASASPASLYLKTN